MDTIPPATFDAFRDHGKLRPSLTENVDGAHKTMTDLEAAGISMKEVTDKLLADAVKLFAGSLQAIARRHCKTRRSPRVSLNKLTYKLPANLASAVSAALADWKSNNKVARMWA